MKLYMGDCLEQLNNIEADSVDMILTDPPYGTTACKWDSIIPFEPMWAQLKRVIKNKGAIVLFGSQPFTSALIMSNIEMFKYEWIWDKVLSTDFLNAKNKPLKQHENIIVFSSGTTANGSKNKMIYYPQISKSYPYRKSFKSDRRTGVWEAGTRTPFSLSDTVNNGDRYPKSIITVSNADRTKAYHPTQKPVALLEYLIKTYTDENETVLDFTMGSGSTGVACVNTNRDFVGIELEEKYFNIASDRIKQAQNEKNFIKVETLPNGKTLVQKGLFT